MDLTVCTRISISDGVIRRSFAGATVRARNGSVHTFLFDNRDENISVQIGADGDLDDFVAVFHVFVGRFFDSMTSRDLEVFRFHADIWPDYLDEEDVPLLYGELLHAGDRGRQKTRHSFQHLGGMYLTDAMHLSARMQAGEPLYRVPMKYTPDINAYRATKPYLPHPGMCMEDDEAAGFELWLRDLKGLEPARVM